MGQVQKGIGKKAGQIPFTPRTQVNLAACLRWIRGTDTKPVIIALRAQLSLIDATMLIWP